jgi:4-carboxymuconolactone decarboxylase
MSNGVGYRLTKLTYEQTDIGQKKYWNSILSSPRGNSAIDNQGHLAGPFDLFLRSPKTGTVVTSVGEHLRFGTNLSQYVLELAIVIVAAHWGSKFEWAWHAPLALKAGVEPHILQSLKSRKMPDFGSDATGATIFEVVTAMLKTGTCDDDTYKRAVTLLGDSNLVDLTAVTGYYTQLAFAMGIFRLELSHSGGENELMHLNPSPATLKHESQE